MGFTFPPLQTLALATIRIERLGNATAAYNVVRNIGGSTGVALATTLLARRSQYHQSQLAGHLHAWSLDTSGRLQDWTEHFIGQGADSFTAARRATAMLYRSLVQQSQVLAYMDEFWLLSVVSIAILPLIPLMRRVRTEQNERARQQPGQAESRQEAPAAAD
jgi:DHA2 family multidrug resistance protein